MIAFTIHNALVVAIVITLFVALVMAVICFQMNLRSVFTPEQQRILERYYDNGMTNQSKACFQLILQCAQEAKLDFSVVRVKFLVHSVRHWSTCVLISSACDVLSKTKRRLAFSIG